jgi:hypothetical protein
MMIVGLDVHPGFPEVRWKNNWSYGGKGNDD